MSLLGQDLARRRGGDSLRVAARAIGISAATLNRVENGAVPSLDVFRLCCLWLGRKPERYLNERRTTWTS